MKMVTFVLLVCLEVVLASASQPCQGMAKQDKPDAPQSKAKEGNPHAADAMHPEEIARIMKLLPKIEAGASFDKIIAMLGLPKDWDGGSVSSTHCTMVWKKIAPGYHFGLNFDPVVKEGRRTLVFTEASFSAPRKPGFPPEEYHTLFPYRVAKGMVHK